MDKKKKLIVYTLGRTPVWASSNPTGSCGNSVAGTAAASGNNGVGVASVAWASLIMPIRVSNTNGAGSTLAMANGLTWAADQGARVANISYAVTLSAAVTSAAQYFQS